MFDILDDLGIDYRRLPAWLIHLSYQACRSVTGSPESWCSWAVSNDRRWLVWFLGKRHCQSCNEYWRGTDARSMIFRG